MVLAGISDLLLVLIETEGHFNLYGDALRATGWRDSLLLIDDEHYVAPVTKPATDP